MSADAVPQPPDPSPIMSLATGFMAAKHLFAASELGLFESLADGPADLGTLASRTGLSRRAARISADAMVALGMLERDGERYRNAPAAAAFLAGTSPADLRPFLRFWDRISYPAWTGLSEALSKGPAQERMWLDEDTQRIFSAGVESLTAGPASALAHVVDLTGRSRLLDVGGGTGIWSIVLAGGLPGLRATVVELPSVAPLARERIGRAGLSGRIAVVEGDVTAAPLPDGHDACLIANLVHYFSPEQNRRLLARARQAVGPGALLLLADFWTDPTHTEPAMAALMAGEFAVYLKHGDVYSAEEARGWLGTAGWRFTGHRPLAGPVSVVTAEAV